MEEGDLNRLDRESVRSLSANGKPQHGYQTAAHNGWDAGTPDDIIEQLKVVEKLDPAIDRLVCSMPLGTPLVEPPKQLDWLAKAVMSVFRNREVAAAAQ